MCEYEYQLVQPHQGDLHPGGEEEWVLVATNCYIKYAVEIEDEYANYSQGTAFITTSGSLASNGGIATSPSVPIYEDENGLIKMNFVKTKLNVSGQQNRFLDKYPVIAFEIYDYLVANRISTEAINFSKELLDQMILNPGLYFDIEASSKSPFNIDLSNITIDLTKPENQKFNEVYIALKNIPEFKKLFLDIFDGPQTRFNVKFEIADNLPNKENPSEQDNGQTILTPNSTNIIIKINKQILTPVTGGIANLSKMAIAKVILHECIHAYLHIKGMYPNTGVSIPGIEQMDLQKVINAIYGNESDQHTFMYDHMVKTMENILSQLKDKLTTPERRTNVEQLSIHPTRIPLTSTTWNWADYFKYLSLSGLGKTKSFQTDFPKDSNAEYLYEQYYGQGETYLDKN